MRIYSRAEFYSELERLGFEQTDDSTETHQIWKTNQGEFIPVPSNQENIPDFILDAILQKVGELYKCQDEAIQKEFTVTEAEQPKVVSLNAKGLK